MVEESNPTHAEDSQVSLQTPIDLQSCTWRHCYLCLLGVLHTPLLPSSRRLFPFPLSLASHDSSRLGMLLLCTDLKLICFTLQFIALLAENKISGIFVFVILCLVVIRISHILVRH